MNDNDVNIETFIKNHFITMDDGKMMSIDGLLPEYPAWIMKIGGRTGVAIPYMGNKKFYAAFSRAEIERIPAQNGNGAWLYLSMKSDETKDTILQFACICNDFVRIGDNGVIRKAIATNPEEWWKKWRSLLGDSAHSQMVHAVAGELMVWRHLLNHGHNPKWTGSNKKRFDFTEGKQHFEVKSTLNRSDLKVTVHGQFQLAVRDGEILHLVFCRMEETEKGESVNSLVECLKTLGVDEVFLEKELRALGLREGCIARNRKFQLLEVRTYLVDKDFPAITAKSFVGEKFPAGIIKLDYTIDLANLVYQNLADI